MNNCKYRYARQQVDSEKSNRIYVAEDRKCEKKPSILASVTLRAGTE